MKRAIRVALDASREYEAKTGQLPLYTEWFERMIADLVSDAQRSALEDAIALAQGIEQGTYTSTRTISESLKTLRDEV